jgi:hypothetical protein
MLLPKDINPTNTLYFNGALAIEAMNEVNGNSIDFFELYEKLKQSNHLSFQSYIFALDWLYLIGSIKLGTKGKIKKCF